MLSLARIDVLARIERKKRGMIEYTLKNLTDFTTDLIKSFLEFFQVTAIIMENCLEYKLIMGTSRSFTLEFRDSTVHLHIICALLL